MNDLGAVHSDWRGLDDHDVTALLSGLIRCESPDPPGDEAKVARYLDAALQGYGLAVETTEFAPGRFNVVARVRGLGLRKGLVFSAHMDTLPVGTGAWARAPFGGQVEDGHIWGRGACDMKSGLAAMVSAAVAIQRSGLPLAGDLVLAFTGGESSKCLGAQYLVETNALAGCGAILVSEPTGLQVVTVEKAALWLRVTASGRAGHLSGDATRGTGGQSAILLMMDFLARLAEVLPDEIHPLLGRATANIGKISGGTAINLIPDHCTADIDLRLLPGHDPDAITAALARLGGRQISLERIDLKAAVETAKDHPFAQLCLHEAGTQLGSQQEPMGVSYFSDAAVLTPAFNLPMVIIGPGELGGSGGVDESCEVEKLITASRIFATIAARYLAV